MEKEGIMTGNEPPISGRIQLKKVYSQPSKSVGSVSADSTNYRLKLFREKNFQQISEAKLEFVVYQQLPAYLGGIEDLAPDHCVK